MAFDHLIFDANDLRIVDAVETLTHCNCIQIKHAVDADFLRSEQARIDTIKRRMDGNPFQLMYRALEPPHRPDFPLLALLRTEPLYSVVSGHFGRPDIVTLTHYASNLRHVKSLSGAHRAAAREALPGPMVEP